MENDNLRLLDEGYRKDVDCIKIGANNTYDHEMAKARVCIYLKKNKRHFVTEAYFKNNKGRVDVLDVSEGICYEIVHTESVKSIELKKGKYPLPVVELNAKDILMTKEEELYKYLD